jgi:1,4-alpha-glucan branching enzyme
MVHRFLLHLDMPRDAGKPRAIRKSRIQQQSQPMNHSNPDPRPNHHEDHYSLKKLPKLVSFSYAAPGARRVTLIGDFNDWQPDAFPMKRQPDGSWTLQIPLNHGSHHYQFLVDGKPVLDPAAMGIARDESDQKVSRVEVL